jgi:AAA+ ATPase superfamily predicted ATPase
VADTWSFYGRSREIKELTAVMESGRWFFCRISGRRRIGKTSLIREALARSESQRRVLYMQVPDSDERGVVQAFQEALEDLYLDEKTGFGEIKSFADMADVVEALCSFDVIVVLDEFQYFHRKALSAFTSYLQAKADVLRDTQKGGLFVLGSIHTEMTAILDDSASPLFNRITHDIAVEHWDFETLFEMFEAHGILGGRQQLFLWRLFEGVPKFYRDCFEAEVLRPEPGYRERTIRRLFFEGTSPLRDEAANWFLRELRGRYDSVLKLLAAKGPCGHGELQAEYARSGPGSEKQLGGYLKILIERYRIVERLQPVFAAEEARKGRYYITDNFLAAWLHALARNVERARVLPIAEAVARADKSLETYEGVAFEKMVRLLTEECSRKAIGDFPVTQVVRGYWNKPDGSDIEIDLVALNEDRRIVRFGSCKRSDGAHNSSSLNAFSENLERFRATREGQRLRDWRSEHALYAPLFDVARRKALNEAEYLTQDLADFKRILNPPVGA